MSVPGKSIHSVVVVVEICCTETKSKTTKSKQMELNIFHQWRSSYQIISYHITSHHIPSYHIKSYHTIPYHIISYHTISYPYVRKLAASHARAVHRAWSWKQNFLLAAIKCCSQTALQTNHCLQWSGQRFRRLQAPMGMPPCFSTWFRNQKTICQQGA